MRYLLFSILLVLAYSALEAQTPALNRFYFEQKQKKGTISFTIPGFLMRFSSKIARKRLDENDKAIKAGLKLMKRLRRTRVLVMEDMAEPIPAEEMNRLIKSIDKKKSLEQLLMVRAEDVRVNIAIKEKKNTIKNLLLLVNESDTFVMLNMKTKLKLEELSKTIEEIMYEVQEERRREKELKKEKEKKKPQA